LGLQYFHHLLRGEFEMAAMYPRIIREFEDDDEPMYWGGKA
jgi:hypothetical protein